MKIYVDKKYIKPELLNKVPENIKDKLKDLFFTTENINKLKDRCEDNVYQAIVFDPNPKESFLYMFPTSLDFEKEQEERNIMNYIPKYEEGKSHSILDILLSENDFNITGSELPD